MMQLRQWHCRLSMHRCSVNGDRRTTPRCSGFTEVPKAGRQVSHQAVPIRKLKEHMPPTVRSIIGDVVVGISKQITLCVSVSKNNALFGLSETESCLAVLRRECQSQKKGEEKTDAQSSPDIFPESRN